MTDENQQNPGNSGSNSTEEQQPSTPEVDVDPSTLFDTTKGFGPPGKKSDSNTREE